MNNAIFLSASIPDPKRNPKYSQTADIVAISSAVCALVHVCLGRRPIIWGGHPAITPLIAHIAEDLDVEYSQWVKLYQSRYFENLFPADNNKFSNIIFTEKIDGDKSASLELMRRQMLHENQFASGVFIGGMEGIADEYKMFRLSQKKANVFPIYSTGGATLDLVLPDKDYTLCKALRKNMDYIGLFHDILNISVKEDRQCTAQNSVSRPTTL
jgi:hypothetical protein